MNDFSLLRKSYTDKFNSFVSKTLIPSEFSSRESFGSNKMLEAMSYSLENGGKRVRPVLCLEFCRICCGDYEPALSYALAIEMVHTYSLIHDDLPCMDNDDMRRGKPSNHVKFGYANALLAGDGLLTLAFEIIAKSGLSSDKNMDAVLRLSEAAGFTGMIAGQVMDLHNEKITATLDEIEKTDNLKTGEMITAASVLGCIAGGADSEKIKAAETFSKKIGLVFQIVDDILDVTATQDKLGKPIGSDSENNKSTYVSVLGLDKARELAINLTDEATESLSLFGDEASFLKEFAYNLCHREN